MLINRRDALSGLALACAAGRSLAAAPSPPDLSPEDAHDVTRVVTYLEALTSAKARFEQTDARGAETRGTFFLQRPGKARFDYDPPSGLVIACDGHNVAVVDRRLKTIQTYPLGLTPLVLFLAQDIRLDRGVRVRQVLREAGGVTVVAEDAAKKMKGSIALTFSEPPLTLTGWTVTDARGGKVKVRLIDFSYSGPKDADFFKLVDPKRNADQPS